MQNSEDYYNRRIYSALRIGFIALLLYWSFKIIKPFILPTIWGVIIAVAIYPIFKKLSGTLGGRQKLASALITLTALAALIIPSAFLVDSTVTGLETLSDQMKTGSIEIPPPTEDVAEWPVIGKPAYEIWMLASTNFKTLIDKFKPQLKEFAPKVLSASLGVGKTLLLFVISIFIAGVLFTKAEASEKAAMSILSTLIGNRGEEFVGLSVSIIRSVVQGVLGVAAIQSLFGGIGIWAIGIPGAGLWALMILFFAIIQLPPLLVLGPLVVYAFTIADTTPAIIFLIWSIMISASDAFLKPLLLGRGVDVPMLAVLLGAIGGMIMSGIIGLFIGAVVLVLTYKVLTALLLDNLMEEG